MNETTTEGAEMNRLPLMDANSANPLEASIARARKEARDYYALVEEARSLGIPTSLDDPDSPKTVVDLLDAVAIKRSEFHFANEDETLSYEESRGDLAGVPEAILCHRCGGYDGRLRAVVALGPVVNAADPTQTYLLSCGHTEI